MALIMRLRGFSVLRLTGLRLGYLIACSVYDGVFVRGCYESRNLQTSLPTGVSEIGIPFLPPPPPNIKDPATGKLHTGVRFRVRMRSP